MQVGGAAAGVRDNEYRLFDFFFMKTGVKNLIN
jgi:hypothetical protein